jgi:purine-binding chemotaxis protein CheW
MRGNGPWLIFSLDDQRYGLAVSAVNRVLPAVEITPLPQAPAIVLGVVNVAGRIVPVVNLRSRFRIPEREMDLSDRLVLARTRRREVALVADAVHGVMEAPRGEVVPVGEILAGAGYVEGVLKMPDGLVLIHDLDTFLSMEEEACLDAGLGEMEGRGAKR